MNQPSTSPSEANPARLAGDAAKICLDPATLLSPVPVVLISCQGLPGEGLDRPNLVTVAWAGTICSEPPMVSISLRPSRFSYGQILQSREFVINLVDTKLLRAADFCGVKSGRDLDKFAACDLTAVPGSSLQHAPAVRESPLSLSCRVEQVLPLGSHDLFLARIVDVAVRADLVDAQNRLRLDQADLVAYVHGEYFSLGKLLGFFGYSVARPEILQKRLARPGAAKTAAKPHRKRPRSSG
jgi:flavin reductase (DIM6/NTAB) family NADH-FMN oxidoreductase RutF